LLSCLPYSAHALRISFAAGKGVKKCEQKRGGKVSSRFEPGPHGFDHDCIEERAIYGCARRAASGLYYAWTQRDFGRIGVVHASADDCKVIAEVGKAELDWGVNPSKSRFYTEYVLRDGLAYVEDCPWRELGVAPSVGQTESEASAYITRPKYAGDKASVELGYAIVPRSGHDRKIAPFRSRQSCTIDRSKGRWHFVGCRIEVIT
jgi:hypothetical protein